MKRRVTATGLLACACCVLMAACLFGVLLRMFAQEVLVDRLGLSRENAIVALLLEDRKTNLFEEAPELPEGGALSARLARYAARVAETQDNLETALEDYLPGRQTIVKTANRVEELFGWELNMFESESLIELDGGYLVTLKPRDAGSLKNTADRAKALKDRFALRGIPMLFVETPNKVCAETDWVSGLIDFSDENRQQFLSLLAERGVDMLDLTALLHAEGRDHHAMFFNTDHHWRPETGLWVAQKIAWTAGGRYGLPFDAALLDAENFDADVYEDYFLGSQGKQVTISKAEPDDFSVLWPKFDVDLTYENPEAGAERGGFEVIYDLDWVENNGGYGGNPYAAYMRSDNAVVRLINHKNEAGARILMIGDSFDNAVAPFLALLAGRVDSVDLRALGTAFWDFAEAHEYDLLIVTTHSLRYAFE